MSNFKNISVKTAADGTFSAVYNLRGVVHGIEIIVGSLETPDIDVTDDTYSTSYYSANAVATDVIFPADGSDAAQICYGKVAVDITGGGDKKAGRIRVLYS